MTAADAHAWTRVGSLSDFKGGRQLACRVGDLELLLLRVGSDVMVLHNYCTHLGKPLTGGRVMAGQITCPFHGACFDVNTGAAVSGPAVFPLHRIAARLEGDEIVADLSRRPLNPAAAFEWFVAFDEFPGKPTRFAGVKIHAEEIDLGVQHPLAVGAPYDLEAPCTAQPFVAGHDPRCDGDLVAASCSIPVIDARVTHGHAASQFEAILDRQAERGGVRPRRSIQPLKIDRIIDVVVGVDFGQGHAVLAYVGRGQPKLRGVAGLGVYQCMTPSRENHETTSG